MHLLLFLKIQDPDLKLLSDNLLVNNFHSETKTRDSLELVIFHTNIHNLPYLPVIYSIFNVLSASRALLKTKFPSRNLY